VKCQEVRRAKEWANMWGASFEVWRRRDRAVIKIIGVVFPHGNSKTPAGAGYLRQCNVLRRELTRNRTRRRSDKYKWTGKVRKRERLWRHVSRPSVRPVSSSPQFILPWECASSNIRREKIGEEVKRQNPCRHVDVFRM